MAQADSMNLTRAVFSAAGVGDDKLLPVWYSPQQNNALTGYSNAFKIKNLGTNAAFDAYKNAYNANNPLAQKNADYYTGVARGIFNDPTTATSTYNDLRGANLASLSDVYKDVLNFGLAGQKAKLAAGGYGNTGPSAYDRILSSSLSASNLAPVLNTIYGNLGNDASRLYGQNRAWDTYRLGQFATDPLTSYSDNATAGRAVNPYFTKIGMLNAGVQGLGGLAPLYKANNAGFRVDEGLANRLGDIQQGAMNDISWAADTYSQLYGGGALSGMGGMGGGGGSQTPSFGGGQQNLMSQNSMMNGPQGNSYMMAPAAQQYAPSNFGGSGGYYNPGMGMQYQQPPINYNSPAISPGQNYLNSYGGNFG